MTPSADIYSLGKVIFYMLSEGVILPREHIHEEQYRQFFAKGERYGLMELLLRRMICPQNQRIQSAGEVIKDLEKIEAWEKNARLLPIGDVALASIEQIQRRSLEAGRVAAENRQARNQETQALGTVQRSLTGWLTAELKKFAPLISSDSIKCAVRDAGIPDGQQLVQTAHNSMYRALNGVELTCERPVKSQSRFAILPLQARTVRSHGYGRGPGTASESGASQGFRIGRAVLLSADIAASSQQFLSDGRRHQPQKQDRDRARPRADAAGGWAKLAAASA